MPPIGFWAFVRMCVNTAWDTTISYLSLDIKVMVLGAISLVLGLILFAIARNKKDAQSKAWERFLLIVAPAGLIAVLFFVFNLCRSPLLVYRAQQEAVRQAEGRIKQVENEKQVIAADLEREKDKSRPKFELSWTSATVGEGDYQENGKKREYFANTYLQVGVLNHGAPSVIKDWKGLVRLTDGTELEGTLLVGNPKNMFQHVGNKLLPISPALIPVWSNTPIPTGGRGVGAMVFVFPRGTKAKVEGPGGALIVKLWDITGMEYKIEIPWQQKRSNFSGLGVPSLPGMDTH